MITDAASREQLRMPEKLASIKYIAPVYNSHNKENESLPYLNKQGYDSNQFMADPNNRKTKAPTPTKNRADQMGRKLCSSKEKEESTPTPRARKMFADDKGYTTSSQLALLGKEQNEVRKC